LLSRFCTVTCLMIY